MADELPETLISDSTIWLFGRVMRDIAFVPAKDREAAYRSQKGAPPLARGSANRLLVNQLVSEDAVFARIYSFAFQNELFDLAKPALFVVNGEGEDPHSLEGGSGFPDVGDPVGLSGQASQGGFLSQTIKVWAYDRDDFSVRLDMMTGTFNRILLEEELADEGLQGFSRGGGERAFPSPTGGGPRGGGPRGRRRRWRPQDE